MNITIHLNGTVVLDEDAFQVLGAPEFLRFSPDDQSRLVAIYSGKAGQPGIRPVHRVDEGYCASILPLVVQETQKHDAEVLTDHKKVPPEVLLLFTPTDWSYSR